VLTNFLAAEICQNRVENGFSMIKERNPDLPKLKKGSQGVCYFRGHPQ